MNPLRLARDAEKCTKCGLCLDACPAKPKKLAFLDCRQCNEADAECAECASAKKSKLEAVHCLVGRCAAGGAKPACVRACPENALSVSRGSLGWRIEDEASAGYRVAGACVPSVFGGEREELLERLTKDFVERAEGAADENSARKELKRILREFCEDEELLLEKKAADEMVEAACRNICGFGVFDYLLRDDELEEISVVGIGRPIFVFHRKRGWLKTNCVITNAQFAVDAVNKMARPLGRRVTYQNPRLSATLPNGSRLHAVIEPVATSGIEITIRKFRASPFTMLDVINSQTISSEAAAFLWLCAYADVSMLIAGNTGSGKTTFLNALFSFVPLEDRVVVTEETPEIVVPQAHAARIVANEELGIPLRDLVKDTLRMRPDRVIIGEVRSRDEVEALFDSLLAGQARGSYATFHANDAKEALTRLQALGANRDDLNSIDLIVVLRRFTMYDSFNKKQREVRRVTEIREVAGGKTASLFEYDAETDALKPTNFLASSETLKKISVNYGESPHALLKEMAKREDFLDSLLEKNLDFAAFSRRAHDYLFSKNQKAAK
jgi:flagellar protein FlaI